MDLAPRRLGAADRLGKGMEGWEVDGGEWKRMKGLGQHLATRRHGAAARASCSGGNEEERKEGWMRGERGEQETKGI